MWEFSASGFNQLNKKYFRLFLIGVKNWKSRNLVSSFGRVGDNVISESEDEDSSSSVGLGVVVVVFDFDFWKIIFPQDFNIGASFHICGQVLLKDAKINLLRNNGD